MKAEGVAGPRPARVSRVGRLGLAAIAWLIAIGGLHHWRNGEASSVRVVRMGHMPVLANLSCPLLDAASVGTDLRLSAVKFSSFAEMAEAFRTGAIDAAFIIAPLPLVMREKGVPARIVYIGNRHESTLVARRELGIGRGQVRLLEGRTVAVPIRYSGHHLALRRLMRNAGLGPDSVHIVEMQPPDMAAALQSGSLDAYFVGEPFAARSVREGYGTVVDYVEDVWPGFLCNVMIVRDEMIAKEPAVVRRLVHGAVRASFWARTRHREAAEIASRFWGQDPGLLRYALDTPPGRVVFDRSVPRKEEIRELYEEMVSAGLADARRASIVDAVMDDSFARTASSEGLGDDIRSILVPR